MKKTAGKLPKGALLDKEDLHLIANRTWRIDPQGYVRAKTGNTAILLHRLVMKAKPGQMVDHINGQPSDNRRSNLRLCNHSQNGVNTSKRRTGKYTSRYKGVYFYARTQQWVGRVYRSQKLVWSGYFKTEKEAALAVDLVNQEIHGEFYKPNFKVEL